MSILETVARNLPLQAGAERHHRIVRLVMAFVGMGAVGVTDVYIVGVVLIVAETFDSVVSR